LKSILTYDKISDIKLNKGEECMKEEKKGKISLLLMIGVVFICIIALIIMLFSNKGRKETNTYKEGNEIVANENMSEKMNGIVVKAEDKYLYAIFPDNNIGLCSVSYTKEGDIGFRQGQEIAIFFNGAIAETYPSQISNVRKNRNSKG
jgi:hypothetical protein